MLHVLVHIAGKNQLECEGKPPIRRPRRSALVWADGIPAIGRRLIAPIRTGFVLAGANEIVADQEFPQDSRPSLVRMPHPDVTPFPERGRAPIVVRPEHSLVGCRGNGMAGCLVRCRLSLVCLVWHCCRVSRLEGITVVWEAYASHPTSIGIWVEVMWKGTKKPVLGDVRVDLKHATLNKARGQTS